MKSVKGRKEGKDDEINREAIRPVKMGRRSEVPGGEDVKPQGKKREIPASETKN